MRTLIPLIIGLALGAAAMGIRQQVGSGRAIDWREVRRDGVALPAEWGDHWRDDSLAELGLQLETLTRVTPTPVLVDPIDLAFCNPPPELFAPSPHVADRILVFASPEAAEALIRGDADYPVGSVVLKQKLTFDGQTELFTGMLRREAGYNPDCGDWEFFILGGDSRLLARGRIESCMHCHRDYADRGFVSRAYLAGPWTSGRITP